MTKLFSRIASSLRSVLSGPSLTAQIDEELRFHLESRTADLVALLVDGI